jgi:hypothetical protein
MEPFLHAIVLLVVALGVIVFFAGDELLARWSKWQRLKDSPGRGCEASSGGNRRRTYQNAV